jgi:hypothetical protein
MQVVDLQERQERKEIMTELEKHAEQLNASIKSGQEIFVAITRRPEYDGILAYFKAKEFSVKDGKLLVQFIPELSSVNYPMKTKIFTFYKTDPSEIIIQKPQNTQPIKNTDMLFKDFFTRVINDAERHLALLEEQARLMKEMRVWLENELLNNVANRKK